MGKFQYCGQDLYGIMFKSWMRFLSKDNEYVKFGFRLIY